MSNLLRVPLTESFDQFVGFTRAIKVSTIQIIANFFDCPVIIVAHPRNLRTYIFIGGHVDTTTSVAIHMEYKDKVEFFRLLEEYV